ncbi:hypothetical protein CC86DRAFT_430707 [Ophiobolus disseminans]|uniref:DUF7730 domain-containing protein n=1 Tax=Ophiobolus disseminans TaxID=1469910 RepID=A0A6A7AEA7_9PLEO|nr:hypothetical protein CC86DRAFT_430707 [Ophiobolus disseminans]
MDVINQQSSKFAFTENIRKTGEVYAYSTIPSWNRKNSPFLRLPTELRNVIYQHVTRGLQIRFVDGQQSFIVCRSAIIQSTPVWQHPINLLALNETCSQIYSETKMLLFELNEFSGCIKHVQLALTDYLTREQMNRITCVCLITGENIWTGLPGSRHSDELPVDQVWKSLAHLKGLNRIVVEHPERCSPEYQPIYLPLLIRWTKCCFRRFGGKTSVDMDIEVTCHGD